MTEEFDFDAHRNELRRKIEAGELTGEYVDPKLLHGAVSDDEAGEPPTEDELRYGAELEKRLTALWRQFKSGELSPKHPVFKLFTKYGYDGEGGEPPPGP